MISDLRSLEAPCFRIFSDARQEFGTFAYRLQFDVGRQFAVRVVRGTKMQRKQDLFNEFSAALQFPDYFGENWDAFEECLRDLEWLLADGYLLLISNARATLSKDTHRDLNIFVQILANVCAHWRREHIDFRSQQARRAPFHVWWHCESREIDDMKELLKSVVTDVPVISLGDTTS